MPTFVLSNDLAAWNPGHRYDLPMWRSLFQDKRGRVEWVSNMQVADGLATKRRRFSGVGRILPKKRHFLAFSASDMQNMVGPKFPAIRDRIKAKKETSMWGKQARDEYWEAVYRVRLIRLRLKEFILELK